MSAIKLVELHGLLGKAEATYGAGGSLSTATDGILLADEKLLVQLEYQFDGARPAGFGTGGRLKHTTPKGRIAQARAKVLARGAGSAYSASVLPQDLDVFLRSAGHKRVIVTTVGAESVTYTPSSLRADWASALLAGYAHEQLVSLLGMWSKMSWSFDGPGFWSFMFDLRAMFSALPSDAATPTITYQAPTTVLPPVTENMVVNIGSFQAAVVRKGSFDDGRQVTGPRASVVAPGGVAGFGLTQRRDGKLSLTIEKTALVGSPYHTSAGLNPYELVDRKTSLSVQAQVGTTGVYNVIQALHPQAQLIKVTESESAPDALWDLEFACPPSGPNADDDWAIGFVK